MKTSIPSTSSIQTPNRFQALKDFPPLTYSMAAETPSFKIQKYPTIPTSSTQNVSSASTQYFTKPISSKISFPDSFLRDANGYLMILKKLKPFMSSS
ncbi:hypothetical protein M9H77_16102 [Catharanthus roseus]|uniref:Uncharacterized protein n=1 Tax=Catharanthus roseus TaxID=4058 RepID=A0ACC0AZD4_CATRO|nr:hypothetical protein M9H77_16102 [Catharanthus roseus]